MKYFASDIVKRARKIADLENSDFINWYEEVTTLNDAYDALYQELVDINDPSFIRIIDTVDRHIQLPADFHQLRCVTLIKNGFSTPILRRSFSESYNSLSYEIVGDVIHINMPYTLSAPAGTFHIEYYTAPVTLLYPPENKEFENSEALITNVDQEGDTTIEILAISDKYEVYYKYITTESGEEKHLGFKNLISGDTVQYENDSSMNLQCCIIVGDNLLIRETNYIKIINMANFDIDTLVYTNKRNYAPAIMSDNTLKYLVFNPATDEFNLCHDKDGNNKIVKLDLDFPDFIDREVTPFNMDIFFLDEHNLSDFFMLKGNNTSLMTGQPCILYHNSEMIHNDVRNFHIFFGIYRGGVFYGKIKDVDELIVAAPDGYTLKTSEKVIGLYDLDENTGYGILTWNGLDKFTIKSFVDDTLLNYPNSFFFQVLIYALAIQFKIKQGADYTALQDLYDKYYANFVRSLPQDVYMPTRVNNVYRF